MNIILISIILCLSLLGIQDIKDRSYYILLIPLLYLLAFIYNYMRKENGLDLKDWAFNICYIILVLLVLQSYFFYKTKRFISITKEAFAWGDVFLLLFISILFPVKSLIVILLVASISGLIYYFLSSELNKRRGIPFAGILAFSLIPFLIFQSWN